MARQKKSQQPPRPMTKRQRARWEREQTLRRRVLIGVVAVLVLAVFASAGGVLLDRVFLPASAVAQVGDTEIERRDYFVSREIALVQQIVDAQNRINQYAEFMNQFSGDQAEAFSQQFAQQQQQAQLQIDSTLKELKALETASMSYAYLDQMIDDEVLVQGAAKEGVTVSEDEVFRKLAETFAPPSEPATTPTPGTTPISETASVTTTDSLSPTDAVDSSGALTSSGEVTNTEAVSPTVTPTLAPDKARDTALGGIKGYYDNIVTLFRNQYGITIHFSEEQFVDYYKRQQQVDLLRTKVQEKLVTEPPMTLQVNAQHILLKVTTPPTATEEVKEQAYAELKQEADQLYDQLKDGADFAELAKQRSDDPGSKDKGGELGWQSPDTYVPEFKEAVLNQPIGEIGEPVRTDFGWHIIKVLGREEKPDEAKLEEERSEKFQQWLDEQRKAFTIERYPEPTPTQPLPTVPQPTSELTPTQPLSGTEEISPTQGLTETHE